jgi:ribosome-binding factor A
VSRLLQAELSRIFLKQFRDTSSGLISITRVEMTPDLRKAHVYLGILGTGDPREQQDILRSIEEKTSFLRKSVASAVKLKYNPQLIFLLDPGPEMDLRIESILRGLKNEKK